MKETLNMASLLTWTWIAQHRLSSSPASIRCSTPSLSAPVSFQHCPQPSCIELYTCCLQDQPFRIGIGYNMPKVSLEKETIQ
jgi:hypothetical protein